MAELNTRDRIIECAFSLYCKHRIKEISLSEIAAAVGISKPAIFKHFKNKEELFAVMRNKFVTELSVVFSSIAALQGEAALDAAVENIVDFFYKHRIYVGYYTCKCVFDDELMEMINNSLAGYGISIPGKNVDFDNPHMVKNVYCSFSIFSFMIASFDERFRLPDFDLKSFEKSLAHFIAYGLGRSLVPVSMERRMQLKSMCIIEDDFCKCENRFFDAFIKVFQNGGFENLSVEKIAAKAGIAKSSIYSFFESKSDLIKSMMEKEISLAATTLLEKCIQVDSSDEMIFVYMFSVMDYFKKRPYVLLLHGWLSQQNEEVVHDFANMNFFEMPEKIIPENFNVGLKTEKKLFVSWISGIVITSMMEAKKKGLSGEFVEKCIMKFFDFIECGILNG